MILGECYIGLSPRLAVAWKFLKFSISSEMNKNTKDNKIIRDILIHIDETENLNQRKLATELGIALGMANAYIKRCVRKGYIKVTQIPPNRYAYYLTPQGFTEKTRLTAEFLADSFSFFRRARVQYSDLYKLCAKNGWNRVAIAGVSELADIAILYAREHDIKLVAVICSDYDGETFHGLPVISSMNTDLDIDAVILAEIQSLEKKYLCLVNSMSPERILVPDLLPVRHKEIMI
ncbi:MAG: MarR family transcriptional regulator [Rhodospirillaceae bacterium]|nr:MarR family transcriptional regulator [Rhodospirillaceae bacterium]